MHMEGVALATGKGWFFLLLCILWLVQMTKLKSNLAKALVSAALRRDWEEAVVALRRLSYFPVSFSAHLGEFIRYITRVADSWTMQGLILCITSMVRIAAPACM